jgi:hypothetical protein
LLILNLLNRISIPPNDKLPRSLLSTIAVGDATCLKRPSLESASMTAWKLPVLSESAPAEVSPSLMGTSIYWQFER